MRRIADAKQSVAAPIAEAIDLHVDGALGAELIAALRAATIATRIHPTASHGIGV